MNIFQKYMQRCLQLAKRGIGSVAPNPMVGCVIVYNDKIIGQGWHQKYGQSHAEVNAIKSVQNENLLQKSTLYVNLEPCAHFGKTPPCADLIVKYKIPKVVIGCVDDFSKVNGQGIQKLKDAGCEVVVNVLEKECKDLNKIFFTYHNLKRPYIILKYAQSQDGFLDVDRKNNNVKNSKINWITNEYSRQLVHKYRAEETAILVGTNTVLNDNPKLNTRYWYGKSPIRIILDRQLKISKNYHIYDDTVKTIIFTCKVKENTKNVIFETIDFDENILQQVIQKLYEYQIQSIIVEGGAKILHDFIQKNLWDQAKVFTGNVNFKTGIQAPQLSQKYLIESQFIQKDNLKIYKNKYF